jgi:hypothetical protein
VKAKVPSALMLTVPSGLTLAAVTAQGLPSPSVSLASTAMLLIATVDRGAGNVCIGHRCVVDRLTARLTVAVALPSRVADGVGEAGRAAEGRR